MRKVLSKDGTPIAFDQSGEGPPIILVVGAFNDLSTGAPLAAQLSEHFTVFNYDRRGRGASGDRTPYAIEREIEDLAALITEAGGLGDVQAHWVIRMVTMSSLGSEYQEVPMPPSQPYRPGTAARSSRLVTTETPNPQPWLSKKPETRPDTAFCSGVCWSVVMSSTDSLDRMRSWPSFPWESII